MYVLYISCKWNQAKFLVKKKKKKIYPFYVKTMSDHVDTKTDIVHKILPKYKNVMIFLGCR